MIYKDEESKIDAIEGFILKLLFDNDPMGMFRGTELRLHINQEQGEAFTYGEVSEAIYSLEMSHKIVGRKMQGKGDTYYRLSDEYKQSEGIK